MIKERLNKLSSREISHSLEIIPGKKKHAKNALQQQQDANNRSLFSFVLYVKYKLTIQRKFINLCHMSPLTFLISGASVLKNIGFLKKYIYLKNSSFVGITIFFHVHKVFW